MIGDVDLELDITSLTRDVLPALVPLMDSARTIREGNAIFRRLTVEVETQWRGHAYIATIRVLANQRMGEFTLSIFFTAKDWQIAPDAMASLNAQIENKINGEAGWRVHGSATIHPSELHHTVKVIQPIA